MSTYDYAVSDLTFFLSLLWSDIMKELNDVILKAMENKSSVTVALDDINGIFVKPPRHKEFKPAYFMYSNHTEFNVSTKKTILSNNANIDLEICSLHISWIYQPYIINV